MPCRRCEPAGNPDLTDPDEKNGLRVFSPGAHFVSGLITAVYCGAAPGARTTIGTAGKYDAISERARRSAAVP